MAATCARGLSKTRKVIMRAAVGEALTMVGVVPAAATGGKKGGGVPIEGAAGVRGGRRGEGRGVRSECVAPYAARCVVFLANVEREDKLFWLLCPTGEHVAHSACALSLLGDAAASAPLCNPSAGSGAGHDPQLVLKDFARRKHIARKRSAALADICPRPDQPTARASTFCGIEKALALVGF